MLNVGMRNDYLNMGSGAGLKGLCCLFDILATKWLHDLP